MKPFLTEVVNIRDSSFNTLAELVILLRVFMSHGIQLKSCMFGIHLEVEVHRFFLVPTANQYY